MKLDLQWERPIRLTKARTGNLLYTLDLERVPREPGVYIFGRRFGQTFEALYVGKAGKIRGRLNGQLNNLQLMRHIEGAKLGARIVLVGRFIGKPGQREPKALAIIERALIRHFVAEGHNLVNKLGVELRTHTIHSDGKHPKKFLPAMLKVEKMKGE